MPVLEVGNGNSRLLNAMLAMPCDAVPCRAEHATLLLVPPGRGLLRQPDSHTYCAMQFPKCDGTHVKHNKVSCYRPCPCFQGSYALLDPNTIRWLTSLC